MCTKKHQFVTVSHVFLSTFGVVQLERPGGQELEISTGKQLWPPTLTPDSSHQYSSSHAQQHIRCFIWLRQLLHIYTQLTRSLMLFLLLFPSLLPLLLPPSGRLIGHQLNSTCSPARWNTILRRREALTSYPVSSALDLTLLLLPLLTKMSSSLSLFLCVLLATHFPFSSHQSVYYSLKCLILISSSRKQPARICYALVWF